MKTLLSFIFLTSLLFSYSLKSHYTYDSPILYASDFFPDIKEDFEVISMPEHLEHFNIAQQRIFSLFAKQNVMLEGKPQGLVRFERYNNLDLDELKQEVIDYYQDNIPYLQIDEVSIKATRHITSLPKVYEVIFKKQLFKHHKGSFKIVSDKERIFFNFSIKATFSLYESKETLKKGDLISFNNTQKVSRAFKRLLTGLIQKKDLGKIESRHYLQKGKALLRKDVQTLALVKKGAIVNVKLIEGNIAIDFTGRALKSAALNESIYLKKKDGSKIRVKVIAKNKAVIE